MNYRDRDLKTFEKTYFKRAVKLFIEKSKNEKESRYESWSYCYIFFQSVHKKICEKKEYNSETILNSSFEECVIDNKKWTYKDQLSLHLAFYMASWGMYRGSSFLLQNDYQIYKDVVDVIFNKNYISLWSDRTLFTENGKELILKLYSDIQKSLNPFKDFFDTKSYFCNKQNKLIEYDPKFFTIITKIMLGTIGCFPALDRNFKYGFGISEGSKKSNFGKQTIERVFDFALDKKDEIVGLLKKMDCAKLPIMKAIDMYYFIKGQEDTFLHNLGFNKNEFDDVSEEKIKENIYEILNDDHISDKSKNAIKFIYNNIYKKEDKMPIFMGANEKLINIFNDKTVLKKISESINQVHNFEFEDYLSL